SSRLFKRVNGTSDVADPNRVAVPVGNDQVVEFAGSLESSERAENEPARPLIDAASRHLEVLAHERLPDIVDREVAAGQALGVDHDVQRATAAADQAYGSDAADGFEPLLDLAPGDFRNLAEIASAGDGNRQHGDGAGVELIDDRRIGSIGQVGEDRVDL